MSTTNSSIPEPEDRLDLSDEITPGPEFDEDYLEDDFDEEDDFGEEDELYYGDETDDRKSTSRRRLHCFSCNRTEAHFLAHRRRWFFSFMVGMTFGLMHGIGPFRCKCCGHSRLMITDSLNPRYWFRPTNRKSRSSR